MFMNIKARNSNGDKGGECIVNKNGTSEIWFYAKLLI